MVEIYCFFLGGASDSQQSSHVENPSLLLLLLLHLFQFRESGSGNYGLGFLGITHVHNIEDRNSTNAVA